ncbi:MAG: S1 RNA-binding domain-containing protein [Candidatus Pacebacteria bacterium]|nr:S1 RNA-binding domain-containing protein [Candidatus Paceibacterota bacterium]
MSHIFDPNISWGKYLELEALEDNRREISKQTQELIATEEQLSNRGVEIIQGVRDDIQGTRDDIQEMSQTISFGFDKISDQIGELNATFEWGFSEVLASLGKMQDSFEELIKIAKSQEQAWAYEQYRDAMYSFRRGLYKEALTHITRAIEGYGGRTGYELEYRFHYLLGIVRIGSKKNFDSNIINSEKAEKAFLLAGRYAEYDYPKEAARAYVAAGWSAYVQGSMERALKHTQKAISLNALLGEAYFQQGKILCHLEKPNDALNDFIRKAIELEPLYSLKAGSDEDIKKYEKKLNSLIFDIKKEEKKNTEDIMAKTKEAISSVKNFKLDDEDTKKPVVKILEAPQAEINFGDQQLGLNTFFGMLNAKDFYKKAGNKLRSFFGGLESEVAQNIIKKESQVDSLWQEHNYKRDKIVSKTAVIITLIFGGFLSFGAIVSTVEETQEEAGFFDILLSVISNGIVLIILIIIIFVIGLIIGIIIKIFSRKFPREVKSLTRRMKKMTEDKEQLEKIQKDINKNQLADSCFSIQEEILTENITGEVVLGEIFQGKVVQIMDFGAIVKITVEQINGFVYINGFIHISELLPGGVEKIEDAIKLGNIITVKIKEIDEQGRIGLTQFE